MTQTTLGQGFARLMKAIWGLPASEELQNIDLKTGQPSDEIGAIPMMTTYPELSGPETLTKLPGLVTQAGGSSVAKLLANAPWRDQRWMPEALATAAQIRHLIDQGVLPQDIAVIAPQHQQLRIMQELLGASNIPTWRRPGADELYDLVRQRKLTQEQAEKALTEGLGDANKSVALLTLAAASGERRPNVFGLQLSDWALRDEENDPAAAASKLAVLISRAIKNIWLGVTSRRSGEAGVPRWFSPAAPARTTAPDLERPAIAAACSADPARSACSARSANQTGTAE
jgi:hypothetical protein